MVRRHSLILESLLEGQGKGTNVKYKVRMTHLWCIYVAATSGVCIEGHLFGVFTKRQPAAFALEVVLSFVSLRVYHGTM
ncbi:hypothetical protein GLOIN_2v1785936 [Rhizophagus irregularis DAOM 181602=DAOM 197198]|nr:hypothetical protein RhiirB3_411459 [Rhizophagus irregularis]GET66107.1 hypothetical protein GLOIN_2v1785936 [Rhizophagus irregularis DAOM 181602=DAOM 197198]